MFKKFLNMSKEDKLDLIRNVLLVITMLLMLLVILGFSKILSIVFCSAVILLLVTILVLDIVSEEIIGVRWHVTWLVLWIAQLLLQIF